MVRWRLGDRVLSPFPLRAEGGLFCGEGGCGCNSVLLGCDSGSRERLRPFGAVSEVTVRAGGVEVDCCSDADFVGSVSKMRVGSLG